MLSQLFRDCGGKRVRSLRAEPWVWPWLRKGKGGGKGEGGREKQEERTTGGLAVMGKRRREWQCRTVDARSGHGDTYVRISGSLSRIQVSKSRHYRTHWVSNNEELLCEAPEEAEPEKHRVPEPKAEAPGCFLPPFAPRTACSLLSHALLGQQTLSSPSEGLAAGWQRRSHTGEDAE